MQADSDCTSSTPPRSPSDRATVFTPAFLERVRRLRNPPTARKAALSSPWEVESIPTREHGRQFVVSRRDEPFSKGGSVFGVFPSRDTALETAAVLPALGTAVDLHVNTNDHRLGYALHEGRGFLGHLARNEPRLPPLLHLARCLVSDPDALALLMEAAGPEALALLGRALHRRLERPVG